MPVRNEQWCLGLTLRALLMWVDAVILMDHGSTDGTRQVIHDVASEVETDRVIVVDHPDTSTWREMEMRQQLLIYARRYGATHIVILDADELLTGNLLDTARHLTRDQIPRPGSILRLPGYNLRGGLHQYHSNGVWANRWFSVAFADDSRLGWQGDRYHAREPQGASLNVWQPLRQGNGGVLHLWGVSERRLRAKQAWYRIAERLRWPDKPAVQIEATYGYATKGDARVPAARWTYADVPESWWVTYAHLMQHVDVEATPWQEPLIKAAIAEHGRDKFAGLDLLGY